MQRRKTQNPKNDHQIASSHLGKRKAVPFADKTLSVLNSQSKLQKFVSSPDSVTTRTRAKDKTSDFVSTEGNKRQRLND